MIVVRTTFAIVLAVALAGCATTGEKFVDTSVRAPQSAEMGRIYIYRTAVFGFAVQPEVRVNGVVVGRATPNGYFYVDQKPGAYEILTTTEVERKLSLTLDKGQVRYVRLDLSMGFFVGHVYPELVDPDVAVREMENLRYIGG